MSHIKTIRIEIGKKNLGFRNLEEKLEKVLVDLEQIFIFMMRSWKDYHYHYATTYYDNTGCGFFKRGIQN